MHGEYKVPGGKLVVVDLEVVDGRISGFHLAGDFFLEPDTALDDIDAAVNGLPAETDAAAIAARLCAPRDMGAPAAAALRHTLLVLAEKKPRGSRLLKALQIFFFWL